MKRFGAEIWMCCRNGPLERAQFAPWRWRACVRVSVRASFASLQLSPKYCRRAPRGPRSRDRLSRGVQVLVCCVWCCVFAGPSGAGEVWIVRRSIGDGAANMSQGGSRRPYSRGGPRWHPRYKEYWDYEQNYRLVHVFRCLPNMLAFSLRCIKASLYFT